MNRKSRPLFQGSVFLLFFITPFLSPLPVQGQPGFTESTLTDDAPKTSGLEIQLDATRQKSDSYILPNKIALPAPPLSEVTMSWSDLDLDPAHIILATRAPVNFDPLKFFGIQSEYFPPSYNSEGFSYWYKLTPTTVSGEKIPLPILASSLKDEVLVLALGKGFKAMAGKDVSALPEANRKQAFITLTVGEQEHRFDGMGIYTCGNCFGRNRETDGLGKSEEQGKKDEKKDAEKEEDDDTPGSPSNWDQGAGAPDPNQPQQQGTEEGAESDTFESDLELVLDSDPAIEQLVEALSSSGMTDDIQAWVVQQGDLDINFQENSPEEQWKKLLEYLKGHRDKIAGLKNALWPRTKDMITKAMTTVIDRLGLRQERAMEQPQEQELHVPDDTQSPDAETSSNPHDTPEDLLPGGPATKV